MTGRKLKPKKVWTPEPKGTFVSINVLDKTDMELAVGAVNKIVRDNEFEYADTDTHPDVRLNMGGVKIIVAWVKAGPNIHIFQVCTDNS